MQFIKFWYNEFILPGLGVISSVWLVMMFLKILSYLYNLI